MNQEMNFETIPLELTPEMRGEILEVESERGIRRFTGPKSRNLQPGIRSGLRSSRTKHPPIKRSRSALRGFRQPFGSARYEPIQIVDEPYSSEPEPPRSERTRWVQDCLNHTMGTQLSVNGIMGPETRSVVRSFQRQQGIRASGIVGPDTEEAIKSICTSNAAALSGNGEELENQTLGLPRAHLQSQLTWLPNNANPRRYTLDEAITEIGGGIYIAMDVSGRSPKILKVGQASDFNTRLPKYRSRRVKRKVEGKIRDVLPDLRFYLARVSGCRGGSCGVGGLDTQIERAISRLLFRTHRTVATRPQWHREKYTIATVLGPLTVENILPGPLIHLLNKAYTSTGTDVYNQPITTYPSIPASQSSLLLDPATNPFWEFSPHRDLYGELEYPFSEAEELELAAELLSISNEEELDLFLGKLFKGIGRGLKKFGRFIGKKVLPALGKGLKAIGKVALPIVGKALGSFIPIPGVGTAIGGAIGTAVSKALELEFNGLPSEEAELEMARRFVRIAATAARQAALANPRANPEAIVNTALMAAVRMHVPNLPRRLGSGNPGLGGFTGR